MSMRIPSHTWVRLLGGVGAAAFVACSLWLACGVRPPPARHDAPGATAPSSPFQGEASFSRVDPSSNAPFALVPAPDILPGVLPADADVLLRSSRFTPEYWDALDRLRERSHGYESVLGSLLTLAGGQGDGLRRANALVLLEACFADEVSDPVFLDLIRDSGAPLAVRRLAARLVLFPIERNQDREVCALLPLPPSRSCKPMSFATKASILQLLSEEQIPSEILAALAPSILQYLDDASWLWRVNQSLGGVKENPAQLSALLSGLTRTAGSDRVRVINEVPAITAGLMNRPEKLGRQVVSFFKDDDVARSVGYPARRNIMRYLSVVVDACLQNGKLTARTYLQVRRIDDGDDERGSMIVEEVREPGVDCLSAIHPLTTYLMYAECAQDEDISVDFLDRVARHPAIDVRMQLAEELARIRRPLAIGILRELVRGAGHLPALSDRVFGTARDLAEYDVHGAAELMSSFDSD